ncbi:hypothetical protein OAR97_00775 [Arcobacteraceae bacterium]|nr:hypothetical protein [Arcobacteraceae bacterium]
MIKKILLIVFFVTIVNAKEVQVIPFTNKSINFKNKIYSQDVRLIQITGKNPCKKYLDIKTLKKNKYFTTHYIGKNKPLCAKDVYIREMNKVNFRFGNLEIEKEAELIRETKSYIKIKNLDGTIEKIYTDGRKQ